MTNPLLRKAKITDLPNKYKGLGFSANPFPSEPSLVLGSDDPRLNGTIYSAELHKEKQSNLENLLIPSLDDPNPKSIVFLMDYATRRGRGIGKTAFLKNQKDQIMSDLGEKASQGAGVLFAVHVSPEPTSRKFWEFCKIILEALFADNIVAQAVWRLRAFSGEIPDHVLAKIGEPDQWQNTIGNDKWLEDHDVDVFFKLNSKIIGQLKSAGIEPRIADTLATLDDSSKFHYEDLLTDYRWRRDEGKLLFNEMVKFFRAAQFTNGLLLVDEVEKIVYHQNVKESRAFVESLRYFMLDGNCANAAHRFFGMLLTVHPGIQEILLPHWKASGLDRLAPLQEPEAKQSTVYFEPLNESMVTPLITVYLDYYRLSKEDRGSISPFTSDALVEALVKCGCVPGPTLKLLHYVIERAVDEGITKIEKDFVEHIYAKDRRPKESTLDIDNTFPPTQTKLTGE